jgi:hypothetical protein
MQKKETNNSFYNELYEFASKMILQNNTNNTPSYTNEKFVFLASYQYKLQHIFWHQRY